MHAIILPFWYTQQFLLVRHPTIPVFHSQSLLILLEVYRNKQPKIFNYTSTFIPFVNCP